MSPRGRSALAPIFNRTYLSKLEKGASYPGLEMILKLARVLGVEPAELLRMGLSRRRQDPKRQIDTPERGTRRAGRF